MKTFVFIIAVLGIIAINIIALVILRNVLDLIRSIASHRKCASASTESIQKAIKEARLQSIANKDFLSAKIDDLSKTITDIASDCKTRLDNHSSALSNLESLGKSSHDETSQLLSEIKETLNLYIDVLGMQKKNLEAYNENMAKQAQQNELNLSAAKQLYAIIKTRRSNGESLSHIAKTLEGGPYTTRDLSRLLSDGDSCNWPTTIPAPEKKTKKHPAPKPNQESMPESVQDPTQESMPESIQDPNPKPDTPTE